LPEYLIALHHAGFAVTFFQVYEFPVPKLFSPVGHLLGHDVGVYVDLAHGYTLKREAALPLQNSVFS
jgi:hypothetical protein